MNTDEVGPRALGPTVPNTTCCLGADADGLRQYAESGIDEEQETPAGGGNDLPGRR
jgi:hypothetical protein